MLSAGSVVVNEGGTATFTAAEDSGTTSGTASFSVGGTGVTGTTLTANRVDDEATVEQTIVVTPASSIPW